jgi:hypothetical protein
VRRVEAVEISRDGLPVLGNGTQGGAGGRGVIGRGGATARHQRRTVDAAAGGRIVGFSETGREFSMSIVELVPIDVLINPVRIAVAGFLAGYSGRTREAYSLDLRQWHRWCTERPLDLFAVSRAHIELYARWLEETGKARATISRRLSTIVSFYRYAEEEHLIAASPAVHVRRPKLDYESRAVGLDRNEVGALLVAAGLAGGREHALISVLALNGLRISARLRRYVSSDHFSVDGTLQATLSLLEA